MLHRIAPNPGSMQGHLTKKKQRQNEKPQNPIPLNPMDPVEEYACMLEILMAKIQEYLLLSDDAEQSGAHKSLELVGRRNARQRDDNVICIWLEDYWPTKTISIVFTLTLKFRHRVLHAVGRLVLDTVFVTFCMQ